MGENQETFEGLLDKKVGDKEAKGTLKPSTVTIASVVLKTKKKDGSPMPTPIAEFMVKHPDKEELVTISKIKFQKDNKLMVQSFWVKLDEEKNIQKGSSIGILLDFLKAKTISETYGKKIDTVEESKESGFLCLKAY